MAEAKNQVSVRQGGIATIDIYVWSKDPNLGGALTDADSLPTYVIYEPDGTTQLTTGTGVKDAIGKYHAEFNIPYDAELSNTWSIQWRVEVGGNLLPLASTKEFFSVIAAIDITPSQAQRIGWTFGNYQVPAGLWGDILTVDDLRYSFMFGIKLEARHNKEVMDDPLLIYYIKSALQHFEQLIDVKLVKTRYAAIPDERAEVFKNVQGHDVNLTQSIRLPNGTYDYNSGDYDVLSEPEDFDRERFENFIYIKVMHHPLIEVPFAYWIAPTKDRIIELTQWAKINNKKGSIEFFPDTSILSEIYAVGTFPFVVNPTRFRFYPDAFIIDYTAGIINASRVPDHYRTCIGKLATILLLHDLGKGTMPGVAGHSVSLQGVSESLTYTQSSSTTMYGAYIKENVEWIERFIKELRLKISKIKMAAF